MKRLQFAAKIAAAGAILLYFAMIVRYQLSPGVLDHVEATVCCDAKLWLNGQPLYHAPDAPVRYSTIYGPDVFLFIAAGLKLFGSTIHAAKVLPSLAAIGAVCCTWLSVRRNIVITAVVVLAWMCFRHFTYWIRPDPFELLCVSAALLATTRAQRGVAVIVFALACGIAIDLKIHAIVYFLPVAVLFAKRWGWKSLSLSTLATIAIAVLPFAISNISLMNYLAWLADAAHQGVDRHLIWRAMLWFAIALLAMFCSSKFEWPLLIALLITAMFASKAGAGPHHFAPLFPVIAFGFRNAELKSWRRCGSIALICILIGFSIPSIRWILQHERWIDSMKLEAELHDLIAKNPRQNFQVGWAGDDTYRFVNARFVPVLAGEPYLVDPVSVADSTFAGRALAPNTAESIFARDDITWLIPRDGEPFTCTNQFDPSRPLIPESFRAEFLKHFQKSSSTKHFDLWTSSPKPDSTDNRRG